MATKTAIARNLVVASKQTARPTAKTVEKRAKQVKDIFANEEKFDLVLSDLSQQDVDAIWLALARERGSWRVNEYSTAVGGKAIKYGVPVASVTHKRYDRLAEKVGKAVSKDLKAKFFGRKTK